MPDGDAARTPPISKRLMRAVWTRLPRRAWTYKLAKSITRTLLVPESSSLELDLRLADRFTLTVDLCDIVGNDLFCMDTHYEAPTFALWCELARRARTIVDLGSHVGLYACAAAAANPAATVLAVEAYGPNVSLLLRNAARHRNLTVAPVAIGPTTGRAAFRRDAMTGGAYLDPSSGETAHGLVRDTISLADLCASWALASVDLVKIDLEGLEHGLLAEQEDFWRRWQPSHVIAEIGASRSARPLPGALFDAMERRGYRRRRLERLRTIPWLRRDDLANWHFWKGA